MNDSSHANEIGNNGKDIAKELTFIDRTELAGKLAAASLPLAYVSGYLIYTSYMGTYSIQLGASDLLRTKYIYIGFHYLVFLVSIVAVYRGVMRYFEMKSVFRRRTTIEANKDNNFHQERAKALDELLSRNIDPNRWIARRFQEYRGDFVVALLVIIFGGEILFVNPEGLGNLLPIQIVYLAAVAIYQYSFIKELREPYIWGLVYGSKFVEDCRWWLFAAQSLAAIGLGSFAFHRTVSILSALIPAYWFLPSTETLEHLSKGAAWVCTILSIEMALIGFVAIMIGTKRLKDMGDGAQVKLEQPANPQSETRGAFKASLNTLKSAPVGYFTHKASTPGRTILKVVLRVALLIFPLVLLLVLRHRGILDNWIKEPPASLHFLIVYLPMALSLFVLSNVALIPALFRRRADRLEYSKSEKEQTKSNSALLILSPEIVEIERKREKWERLIRRLVMATILYVTTVLSFSFLIYPHIPVQKSGGNYATGRRVSVVLVKKGSEQGCDNVQLPDSEPGAASVPIEENSDYVYLASDHDGGGVRCWSWAAISQQYSYRPQVFTISRSCIAEIIDAGPGDQSTVCEFGGSRGTVSQTVRPGAAPRSAGTPSGQAAVLVSGNSPK